MNFEDLTTPGAIPPVPERFRMKGTRTHATTDAKRSVRCEAELRDRGNGEFALWIVEGGVTGFESFVVSEQVLNDIANGWLACAGTKDRWDRLEFDAANCVALVAWIRNKLSTNAELREALVRIACGQEPRIAHIYKVCRQAAEALGSTAFRPAKEPG